MWFLDFTIAGLHNTVAKGITSRFSMMDEREASNRRASRRYLDGLLVMKVGGNAGGARAPVAGL